MTSKKNNKGEENVSPKGRVHIQDAKDKSFFDSKLMEKSYERNHSHSHCWNQDDKPACGIPLEKHTQCCLCDTSMPKEKKKECCVACYSSHPASKGCVDKACPCHSQSAGEKVNFMQSGDFHCFGCHKTFPPDSKHILKCKISSTLCVKECGKWYSKMEAISPKPPTVIQKEFNKEVAEIRTFNPNYKPPIEEEKRNWNKNEAKIALDFLKWWQEKSFTEGREFIEDLTEWWLQKLSEARKEEREKTVFLARNEVSMLLREFSNTPLDKRTHGWDWLVKLDKKLKLLSDKE